jgi:hypothetical protein
MSLIKIRLSSLALPVTFLSRVQEISGSNPNRTSNNLTEVYLDFPQYLQENTVSAL